MRTLSSDTSPEAEQVQVALLRAAPVWRRLALVDDLNSTLYTLGAHRVRRQHGPLPAAATRRYLAESWLGPDVTARIYEAGLHNGAYAGGAPVTTNVIAVTLMVIDELETLGIPYALGGSLASSAYGVSRATMDADIVAQVRAEHVAALVGALRSTFYIDEYAVNDAILNHRSFNVIHLASMIKVDVFIPKDRPFDVAELARRVPEIVSQDPERLVYIASPEDTVLAKLEWYRLGNEVSDRQWTDVLGVLKVQAARIDRAYLHYWAAELGINDLLERAFDDAGLSGP